MSAQWADDTHTSQPHASQPSLAAPTLHTEVLEQTPDEPAAVSVPDESHGEVDRAETVPNDVSDDVSDDVPNDVLDADALAARFRAAALQVPSAPLMVTPPVASATPRSLGRREIPPHLRRLFLEETGEDMERMRATLLDAEVTPDPAKHYHTMKQIAHKIKGSAATYDYEMLAQVALALEDWLKRAEGATATAQRRAVEARIVEGIALLDALLASAGEGREPGPRLAARAAALASEVETSAATAASALPAATVRGMSSGMLVDSQSLATAPRGDVSAPSVSADPGAPGEADPGLMLHVPSRQVDTLINQLSDVAVTRALLAKVRADLAALEQDLRRTQARLRAHDETIGDAFLRHPSVLHGVSGESVAEDVGVAVRSLSEAVEDVGAHVAQFTSLLARLAGGAREQDEQMRGVRDEAVRLRLVPFSSLETRLKYTARVCAGECGKSVDLVVLGGETAIDREMVDQLSGPLNQLVTNAVVHAIESPDERVRAGKPPRGQIIIEAQLKGPELHLTVADDGQGSDPRMLAQVAVERGILTREQARSLTPARALNLMFEPGLTTEDTAGLMSGRGIGLDQVRTTVRELRGQVSVQSSLGQGTIFRLRMPISQTLLPVLEVSSAGEHYAIPLALLASAFSLTTSGPQPPSSPPLRTASSPSLSMEERARLVERMAAHVRGTGGELAPLEEVRVWSLAALLGQRVQGSGEVALLLEDDGGYVAVLVDEVLTEHEVIVRPLSSFLRRSAVWGAAITPDGDMLLLLDLPTLAREAGPQAPPLATIPPMSGGIQPGAAASGARVLVVDDSPTVRQSVGATLAQAGFQTAQARDGVEAIGQLAGLPIDVIVLDLEMPDLDGLGLLGILKDNPHFTDIPVVVLSSRDTHETRQRAIALGVRAFLSKPCRPEDLLATVRRLATR